MSALAQTVSSTKRVVAQRGFCWTRLLRAGSLVATVVALLVGAILGEPQAIATAVLGFATGLGIVALFFRGSDRAFLVTLFLVAFAGRTVAAVASHFVLIYLGRGGF